MAQPEQKPGTRNSPGSACGKLPESKANQRKTADGLDGPPDVDVELVPIVVPTLGKIPPALQHAPNDPELVEDPESVIDFVLLDGPPPVRRHPLLSGVEWLNDLEPPRPPVPTVGPSNDETPDWLADVAEIEAAPRASSPPAVGTPMDWLADVQQVEGLRLPTAPKPTEVVGDVPEPPQAAPAAAPMPPPRVSDTADKESLQAHKGGVAGPECAVAKYTATETGCDPDTGQILDQEKYDTWQRNRIAKAAIDAPAISTESIREVFLSARNAVAMWVDDDSRRALILEADLEGLKHHPEVRALLSRFQNYGYVMREKLIHHLEWVVINRRKYYAACSK